MAERIEKTLENFELDYQSYLKYDIVKENQLNHLKMRRRDYEYKLSRQEKKFSDFKHYIEYEKKFNEYLQQKENGDMFIENHNKHLYKLYCGLNNFFTDMTYFKEMVEFSRLNNFPYRNLLSDRVLKDLHNVDLWIFFMSILNEEGDYDGLRSVFFKAIKWNEKCLRLYEYYLEFEKEQENDEIVQIIQNKIEKLIR